LLKTTLNRGRREKKANKNLMAHYSSPERGFPTVQGKPSAGETTKTKETLDHVESHQRMDRKFITY